MDSNSLIGAIKIICNYLNEQNIPYVVVGGISVIAWGRSRTTDDIDFIIDHRKLNINHFVSYLKKNNFFADEEDFLGFQTQDHCTIFFKDGLFRVDIIGVYNEDNQISINQATKISFFEIQINIDNPESLIAHKLLFGSDQDIEDAYAILIRLKDQISIDFLFSNAERLKVKKKLKKLLKRIDSDLI
jgi:hypothetical protein